MTHPRGNAELRSDELAFRHVLVLGNATVGAEHLAYATYIYVCMTSYLHRYSVAEHLLGYMYMLLVESSYEEVERRWWGDGGEMAGRWWGGGGEVIGEVVHGAGALSTTAIEPPPPWAAATALPPVESPPHSCAASPGHALLHAAAATAGAEGRRARQ
jgi:hypothetical protein